MSLAGTTFYLWKRDPALLERRVEVGVVEEKEKSQKIIQAVGALGSILILIIPALDFRFSWSHVPVYIVISGDIFL